jgi:hypothetical protein
MGRWATRPIATPCGRSGSASVAGELSTTEIIKHAWALGVNPGGAVSVQEVGSIPDEHKNKLITDDALLLSLGSRGRQNQH